MPDILRAVSEHGGVITREAALRDGITWKDLRRLIRSGELQALQRAVYADASREVTPRIRALAAVRSVDVHDVVASHDTAARAHGIDVVRQTEREHVTVPRIGKRPHRPTLRIHSHDLGADDVADADGLRLTSVPRTLIDLLLDADQLTAVWACEHAIRLGLITVAVLTARLAKVVRHTRIARARRRLALVDPRSESPLETGIRLVLHNAGLPVPQVQIPVCDPNGRVLFRIDLGYEDIRLGIEGDGRATHDTPSAVFYDRHRANDLELRGWHLLRFTWWDLRHRPSYIVSTVRRFLGARAA